MIEKVISYICIHKNVLITVTIPLNLSLFKNFICNRYNGYKKRLSENSYHSKVSGSIDLFSLGMVPS